MNDTIFIAFGNSKMCGYCSKLKGFVLGDQLKSSSQKESHIERIVDRIVYYDETEKIKGKTRQVGFIKTKSLQKKLSVEFLNQLLRDEDSDFLFIPKIFEVETKKMRIVRRPGTLDSGYVIKELSS